jgi:hypothetical protein
VAVAKPLGQYEGNQNDSISRSGQCDLVCVLTCFPFQCCRRTPVFAWWTRANASWFST